MNARLNEQRASLIAKMNTKRIDRTVALTEEELNTISHNTYMAYLVKEFKVQKKANKEYNNSHSTEVLESKIADKRLLVGNW